MNLIPHPPAHLNEPAIWQDVEFGAYAAALPAWRRLAAQADGAVVELGAGSGRVAMDLADAGFEVVAVERDPGLAAELEQRGDGRDLTVIAADLGDLDKRWEQEGRDRVGLVIAPLQVLQLLDGSERAAALPVLAGLLAPGGRLAVALVDEVTLAESGDADSGRAVSQPRPDMREVDDWVFSSEPLWVQVLDDRLRMRRMRQRVSPQGDMARRVHDDVLYRVSPDELEAQAAEAGLAAAGREQVPSSEHEAGSVIVILERP
jgi:SAM-dependent methyltransferase